MSTSKMFPRAAAAVEAQTILNSPNQATSDHAIATVAISLLAVADAIKVGAEEIAKSNREIASAIRMTVR